MVCHNPLLPAARARQREEGLAATAAVRAKITAACARARRPRPGEPAIARRVGRILDRFPMAKHIALTITDTGFAYPHQPATIASEAALDSLSAIRTRVPTRQLSADAAVAGTQGVTAARAKDASQHAADGLPLHRFRTLLAYLATLTLNLTHRRLHPHAKLVITTRPRALQDKAFRLLRINPACTQ